MPREPLFAVLALEFGGGSCRCGFELVCHVLGEVGLGGLGKVCGVCLVKVFLHDGLPLVSGVWEFVLVSIEPVVEIFSSTYGLSILVD